MDNGNLLDKIKKLILLLILTTTFGRIFQNKMSNRFGMKCHMCNEKINDNTSSIPGWYVCSTQCEENKKKIKCYVCHNLAIPDWWTGGFELNDRDTCSEECYDRIKTCLVNNCSSLLIDDDFCDQHDHPLCILCYQPSAYQLSPD